MKRLLACLLALGMLPGTAWAAEAGPTVVDSGSCGAEGGNVTWRLESEGTLTISGTGEMEDFSAVSEPVAPWETFKANIKSIVIESGVTSIGNYAFNSCTSLTKLTIPHSVRQTFSTNRALYHTAQGFSIPGTGAGG